MNDVLLLAGEVVGWLYSPSTGGPQGLDTTPHLARGTNTKSDLERKITNNEEEALDSTLYRPTWYNLC